MMQIVLREREKPESRFEFWQRQCLHNLVHLNVLLVVLARPNYLSFSGG